MKQALTAQERTKLLDTLAPFLSKQRKEDVQAICVYGSHIAGYASPTSDYDVIIILGSFPQRIKYYYFKGQTDCSALVVEKRSFENDCKKSSLGEFVSGRLLNPYEAIQGEKYLEDNEVEYKRRVILEGLLQACIENGQLAYEISYGLQYFLFEKLRKRALIYPPVVYSYSETYSPELREENLSSALQGFRIAARNLADSTPLEFLEELDAIMFREGEKNQPLPSGFASRLSMTASYTKKSLAQYAVHGYAGRVGLDVIGKEVVSKLSRSRRKHGGLPDEIKHPKFSWKIPEGKLFPESDDWAIDLLDYLGIPRDRARVHQKQMGEIYASTRTFTLESDSGSTTSIAVKRFQDIKSMKWGLLTIWSLRNTAFTMNPLERMAREYHALRRFRTLGLRTPEIIALFLSDRILVTRFIEGRDLSQIESDFIEERTEDLRPVSRFGEMLATLHNNGYCMGDSKPSSAILSSFDNQLYLIDLEQAHARGNKVWDLAEFIYYSVRFTLRHERTRRLVRSFIQGYLSKAENSKDVAKVTSFRYKAPFQAFIAPNVLNSLMEDLKAYC